METKSACEVCEQFARQHSFFAQAMLVRHEMAIDPDRMHTLGMGVESWCASRQVKYTVLRSSSHSLGIKQQQIGGMVFANPTTVFQAQNARRLGSEFVHCLRQRHDAQVSRPMTHQMQAKTCIIEKRQVCASIAERHQAVWVCE